MSWLIELQERIAGIGDRLVGCAENCEGILKNQMDGVLPRCLILETEGRSVEKGAIVCGINPAAAKPSEVEFYREHGASYNSLLRFWNEKGLKDIRYYSLLRTFVTELGYTGPILWTDIAKCQNHSPETKLSLKSHPQTFRRCSSLYLAEEIRLCPVDWPIVAAGSEAYNALLYLCPQRGLVGVPHPTGSFANNRFRRMFDGDMKLRHEIRSGITAHLGNEPSGIFRVMI